MDKLIELLNEYDEWWNWRKQHWKGLWCEDYDTIWYKDKELTCEQDEIISYLISKPYWFVKWLVDNDKIDRDKVLISFAMTERDWLWNYYWHWVENYQRILMLLAISDTSIDDLISYLK